MAITLSNEQWQYIIAVLAQRPFGEVAQLMHAIQMQLQQPVPPPSDA
jgi:hypothetical protein